MTDQTFIEGSTRDLKIETSYTDFSGATSVKIYYVKPSGLKGFWNGTISGTQAVYTMVPADSTGEVGPWQFQVDATINSKPYTSKVAHATCEKNIK